MMRTVRSLFNIKINWFEVVYLAIALATFQHTMWAAATVFEGPMPEIPHSPEWNRWHFNGSLLAIAIDIGMLITARELRKSYGKPWNWKITMGIAFLSLAVASLYTQILFSVFHTQEFDIGTGVSDYWEEYLSPIIQARVFLVPLMLPLFATIFTFASMVHQTREIVEEKEMEEQEQIRIQIEEEQRKKLPPPVHTFQGVSGKVWKFKTEEERDKFARRYERKRQQKLAQNNGHIHIDTIGIDEGYEEIAGGIAGGIADGSDS